MATRPKAVIESRNGEEFSPITIAKNVLTDDGQNLHDILSDRKEDMMTPAIENSSSMFKVGQGDNVDYSSNIVSGAYEDMVLKGKTMVNCIQEPSSQDVVLPYEFADGQYVTINDTKESGTLGVELKGQTLVNLLNNKYLYCNLPTSEEVEMDSAVNQYDANNNRVKEIDLNQNLQANKKYVIVLNITQLESGKRISGFSTKATSGEQIYDIPSFHSAGLKCITYTPQNDVKRVSFYLDQNVENPTIAKIKQPMIIEYQEGMENWDIPYFEGMASCKMPILHTVGKNLFYVTKSNGYYSYSNGNWVNDGNYKALSARVLPNTNYTQNIERNNITFWKDGVFVSGIVNSPMFTTPTNCNEVRVSCPTNFETFMLEMGEVVTTHEPYKSSILSLPEEVVLRSLPNGVCDTFNTRTGVYTQRIWSATFNGTESYSVWESSIVAEGMAGIYTRTKVNDKIVTSENEDGQILCDTLPTTHRNQLASCQHDSVIKGNNYIGFTMKGKTSEEIKQWLSENPTTVYCELKTPIIKKINLSSTLKSWNTTTHIYSEIPENTLYPILSHLNPAYPVILKPSTKYSIVANSYSNGHTNSSINFNLGGATASTTVGNRVTTITTPSTLSNELLTMSGHGNKLNNVMVIEGDVVGDEPYFEGICDCKSPILSNVGKNLFDKELLKNRELWKDGGSAYHCIPIQLKPNTRYTWKRNSNISTNKDNIYFSIAHSQNPNGSPATWMLHHNNTSMGTIQDTFTSNNTGVCYYCLHPMNTDGVFTRFCQILDEMKMQLEEGTTATPYEPYKSNILSCETYFDETAQSDKMIVLRSLPNGVCDTLNVETGEYVQRIGEVVLDGSEDENWELNNTESTSTKRFAIGNFLTGSNVTNDWNGANKYVCDKLNKYLWSDTVEFGITVINNSVFLYNNNIDYSIGALKTWLSQNPITVQYELATPIVSTIDVQGFPYAYASGHVQLSSGHSGQSLTPKVEYSVITNRNGQIRSNQKMVERHQKQLDRLQAMILTNLVNTQYEQALTNLKYDLKNVREEVK